MREFSPQSPALIIGGGIGGLSLGLALIKNGIPCQIFEQAEKFGEIGAGLQLGPNAVRRLDRLGVGEAVRRSSYAPPQISIFDATSGAQLSHIPLGEFAKQRYGAPYLVAMRPDLHALLYKALIANVDAELTCGKKLVEFEETRDGVRAEFSDGSCVSGQLLIGADGVWSRMREKIAPQARARPTGYIAWRASTHPDAADGFFDHLETRVYLGPGTHIVHYPVRGGALINIVAVTRGDIAAKDFDQRLDASVLGEAIKPVNRALYNALMTIEDWGVWPLHAVTPFRPWHSECAVLLGDAAHAVVPFLAQGAGQAIEDADLLGDLLGDQSGSQSGDLREAFKSFEGRRFARCKRVQRKSLAMARVYHAAGVSAKLRNIGLSLLSPKRLAQNYDWIYRV